MMMKLSLPFHTTLAQAQVTKELSSGSSNAHTFLSRSRSKSKSIFLLLSVCLLAACGDQGTTSTGTTKLVGQSNAQAQNTENTSLLASLAKEYPNGQLPADRVAQSAKALSQNPSVFKVSAQRATSAPASGQNIQPQAFTATDFNPVYRIQNTTLSGSYFFTIYDFEKTAALAANPNWKLEGTAFYTLPAASTDLSPVYRFRNKLNGSYLYTAYESEKTDIETNYVATFELEGVAWRAQQTPAVGYSPLYRFRNLVNGTYLNTAYESEKDAIVAQYPDIFRLEGIAYYVLNTNPMGISGTAATGAPFPEGSKVEIIDATGAIVGNTIILNPEGSYNIVVPANSQPPLIIKASADGATTMYSVSPTLVTGTVNVTPITNLIAARLSPTGNPANLAAEVQAGTATVTTATTTAKTQEIVTVLAPLSTALGVSTNPLTGAFVANGTGYDQLLDSVKIKITPTLTGAVQSSNIDVTVVTQQASGAAPIVIPTFSATAAAVPPLSVATIPITSLVVSGTATKVRDLVAQMQTCYALPVTDRIALNGTLASDITAATCRGLFFNNDPTTYKNNGFFVSSTSQFSGIFKATSTGALFDLGSYEFTRTNGDIVFSFRSRSADTLNTNYNTVVARLEGTQLKLIGNQWIYDAAIKPTAITRTLPNDPSYSWQATGYNIFVANKVVGGNSIFNKVIVTSPEGSIFTLKPTAGFSYMVLESSPSVLTVTNIVSLNGNSLGSQSLTQIASKETGQFWSNFAYWTDTQISSLTQRGVWKYDFYLAANATATPDTTEYRSTYERAPTVAELKAITFAKFTDSFISNLVTQSATTSGGNITLIMPVTSIGLTWEVPTGALAPIQGFISGRAPIISALNLGNRFDDTVNFGSNARTAFVSCATQSIADLHCDAGGNFAVGTRFNYMHVKAISPGLMDVFSQLGLYKPSLN
jgi:Repeat of unknown function (DUF5648)